MALAFASRARSRAPRITRPARVMTNTNATTLCSFRVLSFLFVAFLCTPPVRAQFGPFEGSDATCSIDISTVRVDPTLGERCDPRTQGDGLCDSCICDLSDRLLEAGYQVRGATSIPFESCAFTHLSTLQRKGGVTLMGMMQVASQCGDIPDCIDGLERKYNPTEETETLDVADADAPESNDLTNFDDLTDAAAVLPEDAPEGSKAQELLRAVAGAQLTAEESAAPALGDLTVDGVVIGGDGGGANKANTIASAVAPSAIIAAAVLVLFWYLHREKRRAFLAVTHANAVEETAAAGASELWFSDVTCAAKRGGGIFGFFKSPFSALLQKKPSALEPTNARTLEPSITGKMLLCRVSGNCTRGEMMAIMGPSGSGKSTLLDVLAGRTEQSVTGVAKVGGVVSLTGKSGASLTAKQLANAVAYVPQDDNHLLSYLTVEETVMYSAELQLPWFMAKAEKRARVAGTLQELGLSNVRDSLVGGSGRKLGGWGGRGSGAVGDKKKQGTDASSIDLETGGDSVKTPGIKASDPISRAAAGGAGVSGGERRRVAVAVELVASPSCLALDEPTSGLDASAANSMITTLRHLASAGAGRVVVFSVHQPSPRAFRQMDQVLLLGLGGTTLWRGNPNQAAARFRELGIGPPLPDTSCDATDPYQVDISEWILEVASDSLMREKLIGASPAFPTATLDDVAKDDSKDDSKPRKDSPHPSDRETTQGPHPKKWRSFATEMRVLLWRAFVTLLRDPALAVAHLLVGIGTSTLLGCLYLSSPLTLAGFQNRAGGLFFTLVFFGLASVSASDRLASEAKARQRDIKSGYHGCASYVIASLVSDIAVLRAPAVALYSVIFYTMMGLKKDAGAFFVFLGILELFVTCTVSLTTLIALAYKGSPAVGNLISTFTLLLSAMFGGFLIAIDSIPEWLRWLQWLSAYRYAWGAVLSNEMRNQVFLFDTDFEGTMIEVDVSGQTYLNTFGLHPKFIERDALALFGIFVGTGVFAWLFLKRASRTEAVVTNCP